MYAYLGFEFTNANERANDYARIAHESFLWQLGFGYREFIRCVARRFKNFGKSKRANFRNSRRQSHGSGIFSDI